MAALAPCAWRHGNTREHSRLYEHIVFRVELHDHIIAGSPPMISPALHTLETPATPLPRALPAWAYNHPQMTRLEYERVLKPSWQIVCHLNSLPAPGDFITLDLGPDSVVAVRDSEGDIQV